MRDEGVLKIEGFTITSSSEVPQIVSKIAELQNEKLLIHVSSFIQNTVLVQNLKTQLTKNLPHAKVVFLQHDDKTKTALEVFLLDKDVAAEHMSDAVLHELYLENSYQNTSIQDYRNKLFSRYFTDHLTNLPNMYKLRKDLDELEDFGLIIIGIDNFKTINNFYGFIVGDYIIEEAGRYLQTNIPELKVYKLNGAEFGLVLSKSIGFYDLKAYLTVLYNRVKDIKITYQQMDIYLDLTLASCVNTKLNNIFSKVSMALKYAKGIGVPFWIYEDRMNFEVEYERNLQLSGIVRDAIVNSRIVPYYQAIVDNQSGKIVKYECLARLIDVNEKVLSPLLFIPVAKNIKVYGSVTKTIIEKSFEMFENKNTEFSINLSIEDIMNGQIFSFIMEKLKDSQASNRVTFEILESEAIQDFKKVERFIAEVRRYGAKIAIDDFGSGYSNFSYLTKMNPDYIKIDGDIIKDIDVDKTAFLVVETVVAFAKKLGIKTIAEYVHSSMVMDKVKELEIDFSQGFYIDIPSVEPKE